MDSCQLIRKETKMEVAHLNQYAASACDIPRTVFVCAINHCYREVRGDARRECVVITQKGAAGTAFPGPAAGEGLRLVEAGGQLIHCFRSGLDYAFIPMPQGPASGCGACYPLRLIQRGESWGPLRAVRPSASP
jgi:hypothetical protein